MTAQGTCSAVAIGRLRLGGLFVEFPDGERPHQIRLEGGDASSDSYCFPNGGCPGGPASRHRRAARRLPRAQPRDGLAVRGGFRDAGSRPALGAAALPPIAVGDEPAVAVVSALVVGLGVLADPKPLALGAAAPIGFGIFRVRETACACALDDHARDPRGS